MRYIFAAMKSKFGTIQLVIIGLVVYNIFYWAGKFLIAYFPSFVASFYLEIKSHWGLLIFLELLAVASIFVDFIANYDHFTKSEKTGRIVISALLVAAFAGRFLLGMIDLYMGGSIR